MQIKLWHKQALEDEHCSSKKLPFITDRKSKLRASAVKTNPASLAPVHPKAPHVTGAFSVLIWDSKMENPSQCLDSYFGLV